MAREALQDMAIFLLEDGYVMRIAPGTPLAKDREKRKGKCESYKEVIMLRKIIIITRCHSKGVHLLFSVSTTLQPISYKLIHYCDPIFHLS